MPKLLNYSANVTADYDIIDPKLLGDTILEVGVSERIFASKLWKTKVANDGVPEYVGIDAVRRVADHRIIEANIVTCELNHEEKFDTILMIQTLEHINLWDWPQVIQKLKNVLKEGGYFIVSVPYKQNYQEDFRFPYWLEHYDRYQQHLVFRINKNMLEHFFPEAQFAIKWRIIFRQDGANILWASGRFIKRLLTKGYPPIRRSLYCIWQKVAT